MERKARLMHFQKDGRRNLANAVREALETICSEVCSSEQLVTLTSVLRLGACEGLLQASPPETACWLAMAGTWNSNMAGTGGLSNRSFCAIQRTAAIRNELNQRGIIVGTFPKWSSEYEAVVK